MIKDLVRCLMKCYTPSEKDNLNCLATSYFHDFDIGAQICAPYVRHLIKPT